jgi:hypothetical protein
MNNELDRELDRFTETVETVKDALAIITFIAVMVAAMWIGAALR